MSTDKRRSYSAGILPYTLRNNKIHYLLGRDWRDEGWSDFGGKVEDKDSNTVKKTAMREFYEETMGSVLSEKQLMNCMGDDGLLKTVKSVTLNGSPYYMYFVYVPDEDYKKYFDKIYEFYTYSKENNAKYMEKCDIRWFDSTSMFVYNPDLKLRSIFKRTLTRCKEHIHAIEKEILKEYALKQ